jgi:acyl-CoA thioester hydrolase
MEEARMDWMKQIGWDYKTIEDDQIIIPVLSITTEYKTMSHYGDTVLIKVRLNEYTGVRIGFAYDIIDKETGELRCIGTSGHCLLDTTDKNRLMFVKKAYPEKDKLFKELMAAAKAE